MKIKPERPLRRDAPLAAHLRARGLRARIVVERVDGEPLTPDDVTEADAALVAFEGADRRAWKAFAAANAAAADEPRAAASTPRKAPPKRAAAKRPARK